MLSRSMLPSLLLGSLLSLLMQLACMWPVTTLSRELTLTVHQVLYASAGGLFISNALTMPWMSQRSSAPSRASLAIFVTGCAAAGALVAGSATLLVVARVSKAFLLSRISPMTNPELRAIVRRYLDGAYVISCVNWAGCPSEMAGHMRILLLSAAFYNALACLLLVAGACLIVRAQLEHKWRVEDVTNDAAASAAEANFLMPEIHHQPQPQTEHQTQLQSQRQSQRQQQPTDQRRIPPRHQLPISPVWVVIP